MRAPEPEEQADRVVQALHRRIRVMVTGVILFTHALVVLHLWGEWARIALLTVALGVSIPLHILRSHRPFLEQPLTSDTFRALIALVGTLFYGHVCHWYFPVWLLCMLNCVWSQNALDDRTRVRSLGSLGLTVALALLDGCPPEVALGMFILCVTVTAMTKLRLFVLRSTSERLAQRRDELQRALAELDLVHRRAREQERLSSLGLLAAGIAHEVNNPMSYVKSNLCALQQDLQALRDLPPSLREYVTEVLPETLEGVNRVCSIVADLRRFARGDPEALIEYSLNDEIHTALRITQGRLKAHCEVEVALEPLPPMLGHPRQMSQVVVNLLLNAAQAMKTRGKVYVSTRAEGEEHVVLTVRDTGEGMTPEVRAHLFQPFFTTRGAGEGTGLGLAVVHGIVASHGGSIQVESEPSRGSTFTVRLPRVPPLKFVSPAREPSSEDSQPGRPGLH